MAHWVPILFILTGLPFSGKSTLARALRGAIDAEHIEIDQINTERGIGQHGEAIASSDWDTTYELAHEALRKALRDGHHAIFDATNYTRQQRYNLWHIAETSGATTIILYCNAARDEVVRRWQANHETRQRQDVRPEDFANVVDNFEVPDQTEGMTIIDVGDSTTVVDVLSSLTECYLD